MGARPARYSGTCSQGKVSTLSWLQAFALQPRPGPGGVDAAQVASAIEFAREFEVMEDAEDGLDDLHEFGGALGSAEFSKSGSGAGCGRLKTGRKAAGRSRDPRDYFFSTLVSASFAAVSSASAAFTFTSGVTPTPSQSVFP